MAQDGNGDNRRLRANIRDRIRDRASRGGVGSNGGGVSSGSGGNGSGSGGDDSNTTANAGTVATEPDGSDVASSLGQPSGTVRANGVNREPSARGNRTRSGNTGSDGSRSDSNAGSIDNDNGAQTVSKPLAVLNKVVSRSVDISSILDDEPQKKKRAYTPRKTANNDLLIPLQIVVDFLFGLPVYAGWGNHWSIDEDENKDLCVCIKDVLDAFPTRTSKAFIKALEKYIPLMSLGLTTWSIVKPRIQETRRLRSEKNDSQIEQAKENRTEQLVM